MTSPLPLFDDEDPYIRGLSSVLFVAVWLMVPLVVSDGLRSLSSCGLHTTKKACLVLVFIPPATAPQDSSAKKENNIPRIFGVGLSYVAEGCPLGRKDMLKKYSWLSIVLLRLAVPDQTLTLTLTPITTTIVMHARTKVHGCRGRYWWLWRRNTCVTQG